MTRRVFFLGAGFSKALDAQYPLLNELTQDIDNYFEKGSLSKHYQMEVTPALKTNVEHLLTFLSTDLPWKTDAQLGTDRALYHEITKQIQSRLQEIGKKQLMVEENVSAFFDSVIKKPQDTSFITLNYDLLLEELINSAYKKAGKEINISDLYNYPMTWIGMRKFDGVAMFGTDLEKCVPNVIKLHGSINWYWGGASPSEMIYYQSLYDVHKREESDNQLFKSGLNPYIIPPIMDKNAFYNHIMIKQLWKTAKKLLREANEVYIIGFSMPQSDLSVRFLFQSVFENCDAKVFVVNRDNKNNLLKNYRGVFPCGPDFQYTGSDNIVEDLFKQLLR